MATGWHMTEEPVIPIGSILLQAGVCLFVITGMACEAHNAHSFIHLYIQSIMQDPEHNIQCQVSAGRVLS